jgi:hypothetical protein
VNGGINKYVDVSTFFFPSSFYFLYFIFIWFHLKKGILCWRLY